jgi:twinkle protein
MLTAREIAQELARDARGVAQMLLPAGKEISGDWCAGSVDGEAGKSLKVRLKGPKAGRWADFATGEHGDALDLWAAVRHQSIPEALADAADYLGIRQPEFTGPKPKRASLKAPKEARRVSNDGEVFAWLTGTRNLSPETLAVYRVAESKGAAMFPAFTPEGSIQYVKYRDVAEKNFWSEKGGEPCLFGWQAVPQNARRILIAEGELDALAWHSYGVPALSPTNGAGNVQWIDAEFDRLARFDEIYLSFDEDDAGRKALPEIVERLGRERCRIVSLPKKDANECLMAGVAPSVMAEAVQGAASLDPEELVSAARYAEDVIGLFYPEDSAETGVSLPWRKASNLIRLRPGEVSLLAGVNGHGKSEMAGHLLLEALSQGERCCVASMEFKPAKWLRRLTRQAAALSQPSEAYIHAVHRWYDGKLWAFAATGTAKADRILDVFRYAVRRYGIRYFVVDNLAKCGFDEDDYNGQKRFVDQLTDFARDHDCHVQVCVHMRKGESEDKPAGKMDVKGTGAITDMVDTVLVIWRNKKKEEGRRLAAQAGEPFNEAEKPDAVLKCVKQRNGDDEPGFRLWFDGESHQYLEHCRGRAYRYVPWSEGAQVHGGAA